MIAIVKYNAGNISSVKNALDRLGVESVISDDPQVLRAAEKVIFPGVGEASTAMNYLRKRGLDKVLVELQQPVLGICLGLQLMCEGSDEGNTTGLGIFNTRVRKFPPEDKVPHIGWNSFESLEGALFEGVHQSDDVYYVHSYYAEVNEQTTGVCTYIKQFACALQNENFYATQFHPEKSASVGEQILKNFLEL
jgi:glutamine amidotransferase